MEGDRSNWDRVQKQGVICCIHARRGRMGSWWRGWWPKSDHPFGLSVLRILQLIQGDRGLLPRQTPVLLSSLQFSGVSSFSEFLLFLMQHFTFFLADIFPAKGNDLWSRRLVPPLLWFGCNGVDSSYTIFNIQWELGESCAWGEMCLSQNCPNILISI